MLKRQGIGFCTLCAPYASRRHGGRGWCSPVSIGNLRRKAGAGERTRTADGTYARLVESGRLTIASGLRVPSPRALVDKVMPWRPAAIICDRFRLPELQDAAGGRVPILPRVARWSDAAFDIRALRKMAADGPLAVEPASRGLLTASLAAAMVKNDDQGNTRLAKRDPGGNSGRDDAAAGLVLAAGAWARMPGKRKTRIHVA